MPATVKQLLETAKNKGVPKPRLKLYDLVFKLAPATGRNPDAVYIYKDSEYLGKIVNNIFQPGYSLCLDLETSQAINKVIHDPLSAALNSGRLTGTCCVCGKTLYNGVSIAAMIGPICAEKYGFDQLMESV